MIYPLFISGTFLSIRQAFGFSLAPDSESAGGGDGAVIIETYSQATNVKFEKQPNGKFILEFVNFQPKPAGSAKLEARIKSVSLVLDVDFPNGDSIKIAPVGLSSEEVSLINISREPKKPLFLFPEAWEGKDWDKFEIVFDAPAPDVTWTGGIVIIDNLLEG